MKHAIGGFSVGMFLVVLAAASQGESIFDLDTHAWIGIFFAATLFGIAAWGLLP